MIPIEQYKSYFNEFFFLKKCETLSIITRLISVPCLAAEAIINRFSVDIEHFRRIYLLKLWIKPKSVNGFKNRRT
jgi:hypothetical protein